MMYNIFMVKLHLMDATFKLLTVYTPIRLEEASYHMFFLKINTRGKKTFMYNGTKLWNSLAVSMSSMQHEDTF